MILLNRPLKVFLIISGVILSIIMIFALTITLITSSIHDLVTDITESPIVGSFKSAHTDKDIIEYVKDEHGLDVTVVENHGPKNIKTGRDGYAIVSPKNATRFKVFINSFGAISGDNYSYLKAKPQIKKSVENSDEALQITDKYFDELKVLTDDESRRFEIALTIRPSVDLADQAFLEALYNTYEVIQAWNIDFKESYDYVIRQLNLSYHDDDVDAPITETLKLTIADESLTIDELEAYLFESAQEALNEMFVQEHSEVLSDINGELPEEFIVPSQGDEERLQCASYTSFAECNSFKLLIGINKASDRTYGFEFRHDNPDVIELLMDTIKLVNTTDLPIDTLILQGFDLPEEINKTDVSADERFTEDSIEAYDDDYVEVRHVGKIESADDIKISPYESELSF